MLSVYVDVSVVCAHPQKLFILNSKFSKIPCEKINQRSNCLCVWVKLLFYQIDFSHCAVSSLFDYCCCLSPCDTTVCAFEDYILYSTYKMCPCFCFHHILVLHLRKYIQICVNVCVCVCVSHTVYRHRHQVFIDRQCQILKSEKTTENPIQSIFKSSMAEWVRRCRMKRLLCVRESLLKLNIDRFFLSIDRFNVLRCSVFCRFFFFIYLLRYTWIKWNDWNDQIH